MDKAGGYLLMRLNPAMGQYAVWEILLPVFGENMLVSGTILAIRQSEPIILNLDHSLLGKR